MLFPLYDTMPHRRVPVVTVVLIAVNTLVFLWLISLPLDDYEEVLARYGFVPARVQQLVNPQKVVVVKFPRGVVRPNPWLPVVQQRFRVVQLRPDKSAILLSVFTMMFLHGGWLHLIGNMWFLWIFGNNIEDRLGPVLYVLFYLLGGVVAAFCHWAVAAGPEASVPTVGASGAVSAVLGAYAISFPFTYIRTLVFLGIFITLVDLPALVVLGVWFIGQLLEAQGVLGGAALQKGVAFWAHVGGFVAGWALMPLLAPKQDERGAEMQRQLDDLLRQPEEERQPSRDEWRW
jgi:membrane associated rhomboid family serine protease